MSCSALIEQGLSNDLLSYVIHFLSQEEEEGEIKFNIFRIGVKKELRRMKYGSIMLETARSFAQKAGCKEIITSVPEYYLEAREDRGTAGFLSYNGFTVDGVEKDKYYHYGRMYDGIRFKAPSQLSDASTSFEYYA
jgi:ribosomal protein S18 acetylase RimI-like enzyme